jgi:membrane glycosyltransferase
MDSLIPDAHGGPDAHGSTETFRALPKEMPLAMPAQPLHGRGAAVRPASSPGRMGWRRALVLGGAVAVTAVAAYQMYLVLGVGGLTLLEGVILALFVVLFAWIALALVSALCGFVSLVAGGGRRLDPAGTPLPALAARTALLMPCYNERPARVMAALQVIHGDLARLGALPAFDLFILSDTTDPDIWIAEEAAFLALRDRTGDDGRIFYRRRAENAERKAGNIADWVRRFGAGYAHLLILDADSVMMGETIIRLAGILERNPGVGLVQTLPVIVGGETLFARMQQFAGRVYGPMIAHGIAWWHGAEGNYWGHNAMIRTAAFAAHAGLPTLRGRKPFGGHIMSHDFVEAALLRRGGWAVHMEPGLPGSYEESPPSLADIAVRDRRWCQGNLQHMKVILARGLHPVSRLHLAMGIGSYVTAPLWLLFLVTGILISLQARFVLPDYFPAGPSLFPLWPAVDPVRSKWVFIGTMAVLLGPKLLACAALLLRERRAFGGALRTLAGVLIETVLAGLIAPVAMLTQSAAVVSILAGRDGGWQPQRRDDGGIPFVQTARQYRAHTAVGLALGLASYLVSPSLLLWMSPVVLGLALAIPMAAWTAGRGPGQALRRLGLLRIPEEQTPPAVLAEAERLQAELETAAPSAFRHLVSDTRLMLAHAAMLPPPRARGTPFNPALLMGLAKLEEATTLDDAAAVLTRQETAAVLAEPRGLALLRTLPL